MLTSCVSLLYQGLSIICGFILPRFFLSHYGSAVNGLISSITQFLGFVALAECGVGAVVRAAFYKPLADKNSVEISKIVKSSESFFTKIMIILLIYTVVLTVVFPYLITTEFDAWFTVALILAISFSVFANNYLGMTYRLLLSSDQMGYVILGMQCITIVLNTGISIALIQLDTAVYLVKAASAVIYLIQPFVFTYIVKKRYKIDKHVVLTEEPIKQKWNGLAQHIASVVLSNTDVVVLTLLSTLESVSVYSVYNLVVNGIRNFVDALTSGIQALFGNMLAKKEYGELEREFSSFEWMMHTVTTLLFCITGVLIVPFVSVYTQGITDVDYIVPLFGYLITLAQAAYCIRLPYSIMIQVAGHFKETQSSAIIEAVINILISVVLVHNWGLVGVAIGTLVAMLYRSCYFAWYLSQNVLKRNLRYFFSHIFVDLIMCVLTVLTTCLIDTANVCDYWSWFLLAVKVGCILLVESLAINFIFYPSETKNLLKDIGRKTHLYRG